MECPACRAPKAYRRTSKKNLNRLLRRVGFIPMMCHHCYHKFHVAWPLTIGKQLNSPAQRNAA